MTTRPVGQGMGLDLYLARTTHARLGGQLELSGHEPSGIVARLVLPLSPLLAAGPA